MRWKYQSSMEAYWLSFARVLRAEPMKREMSRARGEENCIVVGGWVHNKEYIGERIGVEIRDDLGELWTGKKILKGGESKWIYSWKIGKWTRLLVKN